MIDSPVASCNSSIMCRRHSKCETDKSKLGIRQITEKSPQVHLTKLNILEEEKVLIKDGKLYVHSNKLPLEMIAKLTELYKLRSLTDNSIIVRYGNMYVEYNTLGEYKLKSLNGLDISSLGCGKSKLEGISIEDSESSTCNRNEQSIGNNLPKTVSTKNTKFDSVNITSSVLRKKHSFANPSDMCKIGKQIFTIRDVKTQECNLAKLSNCSLSPKHSQRLNSISRNVFVQTSCKKRQTKSRNVVKHTIQPLTQNRSIYNILFKGVSDGDDNAEMSNNDKSKSFKKQITQTNSRVIFRKMQDNVNFMERLGLIPIWATNHPAVCKNANNETGKYARTVKKVQNKKGFTSDCNI